MKDWKLTEPAFAAFIVLDITVALSFAHFRQSQIEFFDVFVFLELCDRIVQDDAAVFHDIAVAGDVEGQACVLLHQQNADAFFGVDLPDK